MSKKARTACTLERSESDRTAYPLARRSERKIKIEYERENAIYSGGSERENGLYPREE